MTDALPTATLVRIKFSEMNFSCEKFCSLLLEADKTTKVDVTKEEPALSSNEKDHQSDAERDAREEYEESLRKQSYNNIKVT